MWMRRMSHYLPRRSTVSCVLLGFLLLSSSMSLPPNGEDNEIEGLVGSSPYREPESSPYREPASSPYREPASSPYVEPASSPYVEPASSSPYREPASSPYEEPKSSPSEKSAESSPCDDNPARPMKRYKYDEQLEIQSSETPPGTSGDAVLLTECSQGASTSELQLIEESSTSASATKGELQPGNLLGSPDMSVVSDMTISDSSASSDTSSSSNSSVSSSSSESSSEDSESDSSSSDSDTDDSDMDNSSLLPKKVYSGGNLSVDEGVLCIMNLFMQKKVEKSLVGDILKVVLQFLPKEHSMPKSQYLLFKYVTDLCPLSPPKVHYYCQKCKFYVGEEYMKCPLCESDCNKFLQLSLAEQIRNLFQLHNLADIIDKYDSDRHNTTAAEGTYSDLCDGLEFRRAWCGGRYDLVLHGYTDGVSLSDSSDAALWPLEFTICNIPFNFRFRFVLICGIWVDNTKPLINTYFLPFVEELKDLYHTGVKWVHPLSKVEFSSRVSAPGFCGDAPVRAQAQEVQGHGGRHCCNMCEQKMVVCICKETQEKKRVFCMKETDSRLRTAKRMEKQGKITRHRREANPGKDVKPCKGVKGRSIISKIPTCDRSKAVYPEYMHLLLGIIKGVFLKLWFRTNVKDEWSLKTHADDINAQLKSIKVLDHMRASRSINDSPKWKASECRSFLLFYSLVVFSPFMKEPYFQHWLLLVVSMYLLLQDSVTESDIVKSEILIRMFLRDFSKLYRAQDYTYNLHNLLHLGLTTRLYGPLSVSSAFMYESLNGNLRNCIHGTKNVAMELANTLTIFQGIQALKSRVEGRNVCPETLVDRNSVTLCSRVKSIGADLRRVSAKLRPFAGPLYYRGVIRGETYTSVFYSRQQTKNNYTVCYLDPQGVKQYGEINCFLYSSDERKMVFVNSYDVEHERTFRHLEAHVVVTHIIPVKLSENFYLVPADSILFKVLKVGDYICCQPNKIEVNL